MPSLPIEPSYNIQCSTQASVLRVDFGDGYSQRAALGINNLRRSWSLAWEALSAEEAAALEGFFRGLGGHQVFSWQPPGDSQPANWSCSSWSRRPVAPGVYEFAAQIQEEMDVA